jgi:hypothetical protein
MHRLLPTIRPAISWLLLGTFCPPSIPAAAAQQPGVKFPAAFNLAAAAEPQPGTLATDVRKDGRSDVRSDTGFHLVVISGNDGVNVLKKKITVRPVVQALDGSDHPVAGAVVVFTAPTSGPSVRFDGDTRSAMLVSGSDGRVTPVGLTAVNTGSFVYRIRALYQEQEATATVAQTNVATGSAANGASAADAQTTTGAGRARDHRLPGWAYVALVGGAAAGAGIAVALATRQSGKTAATPPTATVGAPGTPTVGTVP